MKALIDADILLYEIGFSSQQVVDGEVVPNSWEFCSDLLDKRIALINDEVEATEPPLLFLTNTRRINKLLNKERKRKDSDTKEYVENFRVEAAKEKEYKAGRKSDKPFHFYNLLAYMLSTYETHINEDGLEADDSLSIYQVDNAKKYGVKIPVSGTHFYMDYEDWLTYPYTNFFLSGGYVVSDRGKGEPDAAMRVHSYLMRPPEGYVVDHINGNVLDNRRYNLRICTPQQNRWNSKGDSTSKSGYKGVSWNSGKNKWESAIRIDNKLIYLGNSRNEEEAAALYDTAAKKAFGEYAWLNLTPKYTKPFKETIICSRDKDLRQCPLWHYSWEVGNQASVGPIYVTPLGWLEARNKGEVDKKGKPKPLKVFGTGNKFFYYQMLVGDTVDNIGGVKGRGPVFGYELLKDATSERQCYELVAEKYVQAWGEKWKEKMKEQSLLLWMVREVKDGQKVFWRPPQKLPEEATGSQVTPTSSTRTSSDTQEDLSPQ